MDNWDRTRLIGERSRLRLEAILADPVASKLLEQQVTSGNALLSIVAERARAEKLERHSTKSQKSRAGIGGEEI